jgi:DNA helicase-2/ATP-dependent DNA helicase PcrA
MSTWSEVRRIACERHKEVAGNSDDLIPAGTLLAGAQEVTGIKLMSRPPGDTLLEGGEASYDRELKKIYYSRGPEQPLANFYIAHEFGHHWLGEAAARCECGDLDMLIPSEPAISLVGDSDAYSPKERTEAQANLFAREFLIPRDKLRRRCAGNNFDATTIAAELGLPVELVMQQLVDAVLLPPDRVEENSTSQERPPDDSQREAIEAPPGPRQVRAGPGAGKTRTLVGRVAYLLQKGEDPSTIVALTYSNLSAQDLSSRLRAAVGHQSTALWAGTFHGFGYELLRKYGDKIGLPVSPKLLDRTDSLMLLEELLPELQLNHYLDLHEPARALQSIFGAICRAKDELVTPDGYRTLAQAMLDKSNGDDDAILAAEKALEVAHVYAVYDKAVKASGQVDFGDLVMRPVEMLRAHQDVRDTIRSERRHVLVDEYQDMNRASGMFLKELVTPGTGPWVVGDVRQAIYRFRGASPLNMSRFGDDFPGAKYTDLTTNYRSGGKIVRAFESFGKQMASAAYAPKGELKASRGDSNGEVHFEIAATREAEWEGIATSLLERQKKGVPFGDQAVLARSHKMLARLVIHLERRGVPCLYFGDFFERAEIRDLLSLLSLVAEPRGVGLFHVAQLPQYAVPPRDIAIVFVWRHENKVTMLKAMRSLNEIDGLSADGRKALERLSQDVAHSTWPMTAHSFLVGYLFGKGEHVKRLLTGDTVNDQQRRLAVYQLLQFSFTFKPTKDGDPKRALLSHIRRLEVLEEEKQLRQLPAAAKNIDAVKLMTVHASKGLEFPVVHIPCLAKTLFPANNRHENCPAPDGMLVTDNLMSHNAEEEGLFFVGMSRARDTLHISRAAKNGKVNRGPSHLLEPIARHLPKALDGVVGWTHEGPKPPPSPRLVSRDARSEWSYREIETYSECPRQYYYEHILELRGYEDSTPYLKFQSALHACLSWMRNVASNEERSAGIEAQFEQDWKNFGTGDHAFTPVYLSIARQIVKNAVAFMNGKNLPAERKVKLPQSGVVVRCRADNIQSNPGGIVIQRLKASRLAKKETEKHRYTLWLAAVAQDHAGQSVVFEQISLLTRERRATSMNGSDVAKQLKVIENVVQDVTAGKFEPNTESNCATCPYFFICPTHGAVV